MIKQNAWQFLMCNNSEQYLDCKLICSSGNTFITNKCFLPKELFPLINIDSDLIIFPGHSNEELDGLLEHYLIDITSSIKNDDRVSNGKRFLQEEIVSNITTSINGDKCEQSLNSLNVMKTTEGKEAKYDNLCFTWWEPPAVSPSDSKCSTDKVFQCHMCGKCFKTSKSLREAFINNCLYYGREDGYGGGGGLGCLFAKQNREK